MLLRLLLTVPLVAAQIVSLPFTSCPVPASPAITVNQVYAQISPAFLNLTLVATSDIDIDYSSNTTHLLSTVFAPTSVLTFTLNPASQPFCRDLRPPSPLPALSNLSDSAFCPVPAGPIAFAVATPLDRAYELVTLTTQIRVLDTSVPAQVLACFSVSATPLRPGAVGSVYGHAAVVFWSSVAIAVAYWLLVGAGRLAAAWNRGRQRVHNNLWSHVQGIGFVLASAVSGEHLSSSPALLRFGTPSMRDVLFHTQWCSLLGMLTVQWPRFAYPFFAQTAWASLLYNVSVTQGSGAASKHWNPLHADSFHPSSDFADQIADPTSPLFLNSSIPNTLFTLPPGVSTTGIPALAATVGIRPQDAFDICLSLFVLILAGTVVVSFLVFVFDWLGGSIVRTSGRASGTKTPPWSSNLKEFTDSPDHPLDDDRASRFLHRPASRALQTLPAPAGWLSYRLGQSSFHSSVLHGNLVRILVFFHLPISIFSCYQFSTGTAQSSLAAVVLAALAFVAFSLAIPAWLLFRLATTPTSKLYDETRTLLALGPLYNHYAPGSQSFAALFFVANVAYGVTLGCGQRSGTAQAIIILVLEVAAALLTSVWLPWGRGAAMGGISFMLCVARIITAVLLVILSPVVSVGDAAGGWITYAILAIQGLVYLSFLCMLVSKIIEGIVRLAWDVPFDRSKHTVDAGLLGALARTPCCGARRTRKRPNRASHAPSDSTTQNMLLAPALHSRTTFSGSGAGGGGARNSASPGAGSGAGGPPSVLRPEHLNQPYREESDDEGGYILGAWHYDDEQGPDSPLSPATPTPVTPPVTPSAPASSSTSGFSRVAGGRANIASPFTMAASAAAVGTRSATRGQFSGSSTGASTSDSGPRSGSGATVQVPPGAAAPGVFSRGLSSSHAHAHSWRQSQSAIIEDARAGAIIDAADRDAGVPGGGGGTCGMTQGRGNLVHAPASGMGGSSESSSSEIDNMQSGRAGLPRRRRRWFGFGGLFGGGGGSGGAGSASTSVASLRDDRDDEDDYEEGGVYQRVGGGGAVMRMLPRDDEGTAASPSSTLPASTSSSSGGGGSFVVIRDRRPARSPLSQAHTPEG